MIIRPHCETPGSTYAQVHDLLNARGWEFVNQIDCHAYRDKPGGITVYIRCWTEWGGEHFPPKSEEKPAIVRGRTGKYLQPCKTIHDLQHALQIAESGVED